MGNSLKCCWPRRAIEKRIVLLLLGLDNAGKTRTVNTLVGDGQKDVLPTVGFQAINLVHKSSPVTVYDLGGGSQFRDIWSQYYGDAHGVIFVIDSSDRDRLHECKEVLHRVLAHDRISGKPVLILANKQDMEGAMDDLSIVETLEIEALVNRFRCPTRVESYTVSKPNAKIKDRSIDPSLRNGYLWLLNFVIHKYGDLNLRVHTDINTDTEKRKSIQNNIESLSYEAFENPNYTIITDDFVKNDKVINVKEADVTMVKQAERLVEVDGSVVNSGRVKLTPLTARNIDGCEIVDVKNNVVGDLNERSTVAHTVMKFEAHVIEDGGDAVRTKSGVAARFVEVSLGDGEYAMSTKERGKTVLPPIKRLAIPTESKDSQSDIVVERKSSPSKNVFIREVSPIRPHSASQSVRSQLEMVKKPLKRKLSLKSLRRNKMSPESSPSLLFSYEPKIQDSMQHQQPATNGSRQHNVGT